MVSSWSHELGMHTLTVIGIRLSLMSQLLMTVCSAGEAPDALPMLAQSYFEYNSFLLARNVSKQYLVSYSSPGKCLGICTH